jgi:hypothetical protein
MLKLTHVFRSVAYVAIAAFAGCSGGSSPAGASLHCSDGSSFCIASCDLGCSAVGCALTQVAENQRLQFRFNQTVDPSSVNGASFSIRTATGETPDGDVLVDGSTITFVPLIRVTGGVTTFGFVRNETYILTFAGGPSASQSVKSLSGGSSLSREFTCTVTASLGIIDEDNAPPVATLVAPADITAAPVDATYVLRFSEVIDSTPLNVSLSASTPIRFFLHRSLPNGTNGRVCDLSADGTVLEGVPHVALENVNGRDVTTVSFRPEVTLPGQSCVEIQVTSDLHDLSGRAAVPTTFHVITAPTASVDVRLDELFTSPARMDTQISGGTWSNGAHPALIDDDGRHGSFDPTVVQPGPGGIYVIDTTNTVIPGSRTFNGNPAVVTDGRSSSPTSWCRRTPPCTSRASMPQCLRCPHRSSCAAASRSAAGWRRTAPR